MHQTSFSANRFAKNRSRSSKSTISVSRNSHTNKVNVSTVSEYCLIREILFMFRAPTNCKFFCIVNDSVQVNDLVSLNSVSLVGLSHPFICPISFEPISSTAGYTIVFDRILSSNDFGASIAHILSDGKTGS